MTRARTVAAVVFTLLTAASPALAQQANPMMSFFVTSVGGGKGANLGGLLGADAHCQQLATAAGAGSKTWHAYLSENGSAGHPTINAKDRIGNGPWYNAKGVLIANNVAELHGDKNIFSKMTALTEKGDMLPGRADGAANVHDILTGSQPDGTAYPGENSANSTCGNWVRYFPMSGKARVGHFDKDGNNEDGKSWNSAHDTAGCAQDELKSTGGAGLTYCFAVN